MKNTVEDAKDAIAKATERATHAIAVAAADAIKVKDAGKDGDHDLLIRVDEKLDALTIVTNKIQDGTSSRLDKVENRILVIEKCHEEVNPKKIAEIAYRGDAWRKQYDIIWKIALALIGLISLVIGIILGAKNIIRL